MEKEAEGMLEVGIEMEAQSADFLFYSDF